MYSSSYHSMGFPVKQLHIITTKSETTIKHIRLRCCITLIYLFALFLFFLDNFCYVSTDMRKNSRTLKRLRLHHRLGPVSASVKQLREREQTWNPLPRSTMTTSSHTEPKCAKLIPDQHSLLWVTLEEAAGQLFLFIMVYRGRES